MLADDFFYTRSIMSANGKVNALLELNVGHKIFEGHFPGQPVVPGVCMMQMVKEVLQEATGRDTSLVTAENLKFLAMIDPRVTNHIGMEITFKNEEGGRLNVSAQLLNGPTVYFKMKGYFLYTTSNEAGDTA